MATQSTIHPVARTPEEWTEILLAQGHKKFRALQVFRWIHAQGTFDPEQMTNLGAELRSQLASDGLSAPAEVDEVQRSTDGTRKILIKLHDGQRVECVLIPMTKKALDDNADLVTPDDDDDDGDGDGDEPGTPARGKPRRATLCISTQVGCAMGCVFCASGKAGLTRALGAEEIVAQVLVARQFLNSGEQLRNLVFMGMGEPLHHYEQTRRAIKLITHPDGLGMSPRRITVSTVGLVPGIRKLGEDFDGKLGLAISLHAPDNATRDQILPMNKKYDVELLLQSLRDYPLPKRRRITIEYTLIGGVNDSDQHALRLVRVLRGIRVKVNLIPMNPIDASNLKAPSTRRVDAFQAILADARVSASVRTRRGDDVDAACGQLALKKSKLIAAESLVGPR